MPQTSCPLPPPAEGRYARQIILPGFGPEAQNKLAQSKVLVVGCGGLGCPAALYLAAAGVGQLILVDGDTVSLSNLHRQILFTEAHIGKNKAQVAAEALALQNPHIKIQAIPKHLCPSFADSCLSEVDAVVDATDNFSTRLFLSDLTRRHNTPLVYASVLGFEARVGVFNRTPNSPCYRCMHPGVTPQTLVPNCAESGVLGALPGMAGSLQAMETIKLLADLPGVMDGTLFVWNALAARPVRVTVPILANCTHKAPLEERTNLMNLDVKHIDVEELADILKNPGVTQVIDVREPDERAAGSIPQTLHMPLGSLEALLKSQNWSSDTPLVFYCRSGRRSVHAAEVGLSLGFASCTSVDGGILAWQEVFGS